MSDIEAENKNLKEEQSEVSAPTPAMKIKSRIP